MLCNINYVLKQVSFYRLCSCRHLSSHLWNGTAPFHNCSHRMDYLALSCSVSIWVIIGNTDRRYKIASFSLNLGKKLTKTDQNWEVRTTVLQKMTLSPDVRRQTQRGGTGAQILSQWQTGLLTNCNAYLCLLVFFYLLIYLFLKWSNPGYFEYLYS